MVFAFVDGTLVPPIVDAFVLGEVARAFELLIAMLAPLGARYW